MAHDEATSTARPAPDEDLAQRRAGQGPRTKAKAIHTEMNAQRRMWDKRRSAYPEERFWIRGAEGEEFVGALLNLLHSSGWRALHNVTVRSSGTDIDHLLIGPGGIFTLNTKNHSSGNVWVGQSVIKVNWQSKKYLPAARHEARRAQALLRFATGWKLHVVPALVILTGPKGKVTIAGNPRTVIVLTAAHLPEYFLRLTPYLTPAHVEYIYNRARWGHTWFPDAKPVALPPPPRKR